jgi:hypothetical protein
MSEENQNKIPLNFVDSFLENNKEIIIPNNDNSISKNNPIKDKTNILNDKLNNNHYFSKYNTNPKNKNSILQKTFKKKVVKNNDINMDINKKILFSERTKNSTGSNFFPKSTRYTDNSFRDIKKSFYTTSNNLNSSTNEIFKANQESLKERKAYEEKVKILQNHIKALRKQEEEIYKKEKMNREKEKYLNKKKKEKENRKKALLSAEIDKRNALEEKKRTTLEQKIMTNRGLKASQEKIINEKINKYKKAINDKKKTEEKRIENKNNNEKYNHLQIEKIKNERAKIREKNLEKKYENINKLNNSYKISYEKNIDEAKRLKNELSKLEIVEEQCLENLKKTQEFIKKNNPETFKLNRYKIIKINDTYFYKIKKNKRIANSAKKRNQIIILPFKTANIKDKTSSAPKII